MKINALRRAVGQITIQVGVKKIKEAIPEFSDIEKPLSVFALPFANYGLSVAQLDNKYYFTSYENWLKIIETINPILKEFHWQREKFDCDKRSYLVVALTALFFGINTVRPVYCDVYKVSDDSLSYAHYANVFVDANGIPYLWDVDNGGLFEKITSKTPVIGNYKYKLKAIK